MSDYVIVGAGAFAREIYDWFDAALGDKGHKFTGYLEDVAGTTSVSAFGNLPRLGEIRESDIDPSWHLVMGVAACDVKRDIAARLANVQPFANLVHPTSIISPSAQLGHGVIFAPFSLASANSRIGNFVSVNVHSSVGHDVTLSDYSTLSSYVDLTGRVTVGEASFWGSGSRALPGVAIGAGAKIGAGSVVMRGVKAGATVFVPPARTL